MKTNTAADEEEEDNEEDDEETGAKKSAKKSFANETDDDECYDYLLSMPIKSFTNKKLKELSDSVKKLKGEIKDLEAKSLKNLWENDLVEFEKELDKQDKRDQDTINNAIKKKQKAKGHKKAKKPIVAVTKKEDGDKKPKVDKDGKKIQGPKALPGAENTKKKKKENDDDSTQDNREKKPRKPKKKKEDDSDTDVSTQQDKATKKPKKEKVVKEAKPQESTSLFDKYNVNKDKWASDLDSSADKVNNNLKRKQNGKPKANVKKMNLGDSDSDSDGEDGNVMNYINSNKIS